MEKPQSVWRRIWEKRRIRLWAGAVVGITGLLGVQAMNPQWQFLPHLPGQLGPGTALVIFLLAMACEFIDSSMGMGYGTTLTPLLLLAGFQPLQIVPCVLLSELVTGFGAGLQHHRDGNVNLTGDPRARETAILLSVLSLFGAAGAVFLAVHISKFWLNVIIAVIILSAGFAILATFRRQFRYRRRHILVVGLVAAFNKGLSGGGYGPLTTAGQVVSGLSPKQAVAITSVAEGFTCLVGLAAYFLLHGRLDLTLALPLTFGASLSVPLATLTVRKLPESLMRAGVGVATCLLGIVALAKVLG
jgi:uncharacterized membrane protein YfcA